MSNSNISFDFIFVGSCSPSHLIQTSIDQGRKGIDFATNNFQKNLLNCFSKTGLKYFSVISPFFSPSSNYYFKTLPNKERDCFYLPFTTIPILRNAFEFLLVFFYLIFNYPLYRGPFIVFSLHSSFLSAVFLFKLLTFNL